MVKEMFAFGYDQDEWYEKTETWNPMFVDRIERTAVTVFQWEFTVPNDDNNIPKSPTFWLDGFELYGESVFNANQVSFLRAPYQAWRNSIQLYLHPAAKMKKLAVQFSVYLRHLATRELD